MDIQALDQFRSPEELANYQSEVRGRLTALNLEFPAQQLPDAERAEFATLTEQNDEIGKRLREIEQRRRYIEEFASNENNRERVDDTIFDRQIGRGSLKERDIYDLSTVRADWSHPEAANQEFHDRAMRAVEISTFPQVRDQDAARTQLEKLLDRDTGRGGDKGPAEIARRILTTGSPAYKRGFLKYLKKGAEADWTTEERTAMAEGAGGTGGYAIVYQLDPTFIPTSDLAVNPFRAISNVSTIAGTNEWRGVTSGAITAAYAAEGTEASDNSPTLTQPALITQRAQAFVPVSMELSMDLPALQGELAKLIQDAKDVLETTQYTTGVGTTVFPQGILVGSTNTILTTASSAFAVADVYAVEAALGPRFRTRASFLANRATYQLVRQFDTSGFGALWTSPMGGLQPGLTNQVPTPGGIGTRLIGYPTYEDSAMAPQDVSGLDTGDLGLVLGDFNYFKIVDRLGLDVQVIPTLFGTARGYPTGQTGIYAIWRNTSRVLASSAFVILQVK